MHGLQAVERLEVHICVDLALQHGALDHGGIGKVHAREHGLRLRRHAREQPAVGPRKVVRRSTLGTVNRVWTQRDTLQYVNERHDGWLGESARCPDTCRNVHFKCSSRPVASACFSLLRRRVGVGCAQPYRWFLQQSCLMRDDAFQNGWKNPSRLARPVGVKFFRVAQQVVHVWNVQFRGR